MGFLWISVEKNGINMIFNLIFSKQELNYVLKLGYSVLKIKTKNENIAVNENSI